MREELERKTANAFKWSMLQSWSVKMLSLLLFFVLARYLDQHQMGLAQTVTVLLALVALLSEQGFQNAIIQRTGLHDRDVNAPFFISFGLAIFASAVMLIFSEELASALHDPAVAELIHVAALIPPITAANGIVIAMLRRKLDFKPIAQAAFVSSITSGALALGLVLIGWGAMALVVQAAASGLVTSLIVWSRPGWRPTLLLDTGQLKWLFQYSSATFASQLIGFFSNRLLDVAVLARYGLAALGVYTVGGKLYFTLLELLATALVVVAMSSMAKVSADKILLRKMYLQFIYLSACITMPLFVVIAALSFEISGILFGPNWPGASEVAHALCLLGAVQVVQFFNGAVLDATGNPRSSLVINMAKLAVGMAILLLFPAENIKQLIVAFVVGQICIAPLSFVLAMRVTDVTWTDLMREIAPGATSAMVGYWVIDTLRGYSGLQGWGPWSLATLLGATFACVYCGVLTFVDGRTLVHKCRNVLS